VGESVGEMVGWTVGVNSAVLIGSGIFVGSSVAVERTLVEVGCGLPEQADTIKIRTKNRIKRFICPSYHQQNMSSTCHTLKKNTPYKTNFSPS